MSHSTTFERDAGIEGFMDVQGSNCKSSSPANEIAPFPSVKTDMLREMVADFGEDSLL